MVMPITSNLFGIDVNSRFGNKICLMVLTQRLCYNKQKVLTLREHMNSLQFFGGFCVVYIFILFCLPFYRQLSMGATDFLANTTEPAQNILLKYY
jgi:hypothetical protein